MIRALLAATAACVAVAATLMASHAGTASRVGGHSPKKTVRVRRVARATPQPTVSVVPTRSAASVGTLENIVQTLSNCVPASVAEVMAYWHVYRTQDQVQAVIRADGWSLGTSPYGIPPYVRRLGLRAFIGTAGTESLVKALISNGFPVLVEQWVSADDQVYHYRPVEAYDDQSAQFVTSDPYLGAGHPISYAEFNSIWQATDGRFMVIYPPSLRSRLQAVLRSAGWNAHAAYARDLAWQQSQQQTAGANTAGDWIWYNVWVGTAWDQAELGHEHLAETALATASRMGNSSTVIGWVQHDIRLLQQGT